MRKTLVGITYMTTALVLVLALGACTNLLKGNQADATLSLNLTDAPLDDPSVTGVFVEIEKIEYRLSDDEGGEFFTVDSYDPENPNNPYNVLELTGGTVTPLGDIAIPSGSYNSLQIRLYVGGPDKASQTPPTTPSSFVDYNDNGVFDDTDEALFIPSAAQTGIKLNAPEFTVPENDQVTITADFDARRSVVTAGASGRFILKPTIRLIVDDQAGSIAGDISGSNTDSRYTVLAYEDGAYEESEAANPGDEATRFPNAVSSSPAEDNDGDGDLDYEIAFLAAGTYDLYVAEYQATNTDGEYVYVGGDGSGEPITGPADVEVTAGGTTTTDISIAP
ncbi:MAG: DUF4382 domain-containing protein [Spirochaetes bacterium]|jgi:hypothetical protein|nr:DUF4382 domain-containing protein [Spirochaetota bacterium]